MYRIFRQFALLSVMCGSLNAAQGLPSTSAPVDGEEEALPAFARVSSTVMLDAEFRSIHRYMMFAGCKVAPLTEVEAEVAAFEKNAETAPAELEGLRPDAAQALDHLREMVTSLGGTFALKSAYRPPAYQAHLHEVWMAWVKGLRNNRSSGCRALREEVGAEFARHQLLVRQQPVPASDHALGLAFDAAVALPRAARMNGKRVTVDKLAAMAGIRRPNSRRDPVHFKLIPESPTALSYSQTVGF